MTIVLYVLGGIATWAVLAVAVVAFVSSGSSVSAEEMVERASVAFRERERSAAHVPSESADVASTTGERGSWIAVHWQRAVTIGTHLRATLQVSGSGTMSVDGRAPEPFVVVDVACGERTMTLACRTAAGTGVITDLRGTGGVDGAIVAQALGARSPLDAAHWNVLLTSLAAWITEIGRVAPRAELWHEVHRQVVPELVA